MKIDWRKTGLENVFTKMKRGMDWQKKKIQKRRIETKKCYRRMNRKFLRKEKQTKGRTTVVLPSFRKTSKKADY